MRTGWVLQCTTAAPLSIRSILSAYTERSDGAEEEEDIRLTGCVEYEVCGISRRGLDTHANAFVHTKKLWTQYIFLEVETNELGHQRVHLIVLIEDESVIYERIVLDWWAVIAQWR